MGGVLPVVTDLLVFGGSSVDPSGITTDFENMAAALEVVSGGRGFALAFGFAAFLGVLLFIAVDKWYAAVVAERSRQLTL